MSADAKLHEHINPDAGINEHRRPPHSSSKVEGRGATVSPKPLAAPAGYKNTKPAGSPGALDERDTAKGTA